MQPGGAWVEAEELAQHAFVRVYARWSRVARGNAEGYLRTVLTRLFLDTRRRGRGRERLVADTSQVADPPEKREGWDYETDVTDARGTGSVRFGVGDYTGTPLAAADEQAFDVGNCAPPKRQVLADGTVLQIYETRPSEPFQSLTQVLRIFLPDGKLYQLVVQNWGSPDFEPNPVQPEFPNRVGAGRETLPLTEAQLAEIGLAIAR